MGRISKRMVEVSYEIGKQFYNKAISFKDGKDELTKIGMNDTSADFYSKNYSNLRNGIAFQRTINAFAMDYYLNGIYKEHGNNGLQNALLALSQHIAYFEDKSGATAEKNRELLEKFSRLINYNSIEPIYPDEVDPEEDYTEGKSKKVLVNSYERNPIARKKCIEYFGLNCQVCGFNFKDIYGDLGSDFIHVHHKIEVSTVGNEYSVNPLVDLIPVCPNCHAMLHKRKPAYTVEELKRLME